MRSLYGELSLLEQNEVSFRRKRTRVLKCRSSHLTHSGHEQLQPLTMYTIEANSAADDARACESRNLNTRVR